MKGENKRERIVIIGGGFAGLNLIKRLDKRRYEVILIDRNNYHSFPPLFYQIASSGLEPGSINFPFRRELRRYRKKGVQFRMAEVTGVDTTAKMVKTKRGDHIPYDHLIIAAGSTNNFFGNKDLEKYVYTLKSTAEAIRCRNEILSNLEHASATKDPTERRRLLNFVVIGGGATGVEVAGAIGEMKRYVLPREYPEIDPDDMQITIVEGSGSLLQSMSPSAQTEVERYLGHLMVTVRTGLLMKSYEDGVVTLSDGSTLRPGMVIWTAGVTGVPFKFDGEAPQIGPGGRIIVDEFNRVKGLDNVYAVGDICFNATERYPRGYPQLAQVAIQQARLLARQLNKGEFVKPFEYVDRGSMATVGRNRAVADLNHIHLYGRPAWFTWMFIHLISILGMRNKLTVLINWIWAYFTYSTSLQLLLLPTKYPLRKRWGES